MTIGIFLKTLDEDYQLSVFRNVRNVTQKLGINLVCIQKEYWIGKQLNSKDIFPSKHYIKFDGIMLCAADLVNTYEENLENLNIKDVFGDIPVISLGRRVGNIPSIIIKNHASMENLMNHLIEVHGYRKFLYISGPKNHHDNITREKVFKHSLSILKHKDPSVECSILRADFTEEVAANVLQEFIDNHPFKNVDVIVCANDNMAFGVQKVLRMQSGKWKDCAITGFDDVAQASLEVPPLTTIRQPLSDFAELAVQTLVNMIEKKNVTKIQRVESEVCIRQSCGCKSNILPFQSPKKAAELKTLLDRVLYQSVKNEQLSMNLSYFGQNLNAVNSLEEMMPFLKKFLTNFKFRSFFLFLFDGDSSVMPLQAKLSFEYYMKSDAVYHENENLCVLKDFFLDRLNKNQLSSQMFIQYLEFGKEKLGLIVYDCEDYVHAYIGTGVVFIANVLKRLKLFNDEKKRSLQLEHEVYLRTKELIDVNKELQLESAERIRVEGEVLKISELERMRFSMDLHDDICQRLAGISMFCKGLSAKNPQLLDLSEMIDETLHRTRQYAHDSFPMEIESLGLKKALEGFCHNIMQQVKIDCNFTWDVPQKPCMTSVQQINIYRITQEAVQNALKHAKASTINVDVFIEDDMFTVKISDDGRGMPIAATSEEYFHNKSSIHKQGIGLRSMKYRADQVNGIFSIESKENEGTRIILQIPNWCC